MFDLYLIIAIVIVSLIGGYILLQILSNLNKPSISDYLFGAWVFNADRLNEKGKKYRHFLFLFWLIVVLLVILIEAMSAGNI